MLSMCCAEEETNIGLNVTKKHNVVSVHCSKKKHKRVVILRTSSYAVFFFILTSYKDMLDFIYYILHDMVKK